MGTTDSVVYRLSSSICRLDFQHGYSVILEFDLPSYRTNEARSRHRKQESDRQK